VAQAAGRKARASALVSSMPVVGRFWSAAAGRAGAAASLRAVPAALLENSFLRRVGRRSAGDGREGWV
jgi:hypothetical protein